MTEGLPATSMPTQKALRNNDFACFEAAQPGENGSAPRQKLPGPPLEAVMAGLVPAIPI